MMSLKSLMIAGAVVCLLTACHSNSYKVRGTVEGLPDGDTLFFTTDLVEAIPSDTIIVEGGKFEMSGECDSVQIAMIYSARHNELNANFFVEPGEIVVTISKTPGESRVGGTLCNDRWQVFNDSVTAIGKRINKIAESAFGNQMKKEDQEVAMKKIEALNDYFNDMLMKSAEKNIDNEFGFFLLTYFPKEYIDNENRLRLIEKMPEELRQRSAIQELLGDISNEAKSDAGNIIPDFAQSTPDGGEMHLMEEVSKNKVTIIDFWASWCGPCRQEMPFMVKLYKSLNAKGLGIVGVSLDNNEADWKAAISQLELPWPQMSDLKGWDNEAAQFFNVTAIPFTVVVDQQGVVLQKNMRGQELQKFVTELLEK